MNQNRDTKLTPEKRRELVSERKKRGFPWHGPPHFDDQEQFHIVTAACYQHREILDSHERLCWFESELIDHLKKSEISCAAWVVLPNHYHVLVKTSDVNLFSHNQGLLHGRTSKVMNSEDNTLGRKIWYRCQDRAMRSERHYFTSINYIHNNPVKHRLVKKWGDWACSSFHWYLANKGRDWLINIWREYPVMKYGEGWDD